MPRPLISAALLAFVLAACAQQPEQPGAPQSGAATGATQAPANGGPASGEAASGEFASCIPLRRITESRTIDDQTLLFILSGKRDYVRIDLAYRCDDITVYGYGHRSFNGDFCRTDTLTSLGPIHMGCMIKSMHSISREEAEALMRKKETDRHHGDSAAPDTPAAPADGGTAPASAPAPAPVSGTP